MFLQDRGGVILAASRQGLEAVKGVVVLQNVGIHLIVIEATQEVVV